MVQQPHVPTDWTRVPLAPSVLYVLVSLAAGQRSARDVATEVRRLSAESVSERTTRRLLGRMKTLEVVSTSGGRPEAATQDFELTPLGAAILCDDIQRLKALIDRIDVQALCAAVPPRGRSS
jgi:hypothetical protein